MNRSRVSSRAVAVTAGVLAVAGVVGAQAQQQAVQAQLAARRVARPGMPAAGPGGVVNLPYMVADNSGTQWRVFQGGWLQQSGNMPLYSQGAMLTVNGQQVGAGNNTARVDADTGEVVFENMNANGMSITRRILIDKDAGYVRYVDLVKNTTGQEQTVNLQVNSNFNYGLRGGQNVPDPRRKGQDVAWVGQTHANGLAVVEMYAGKGSKVDPNINGQVNNNVATGALSFTLKAGKEAGVLHLHAVAASVEAGVALVTNLKEKDLLASVPREVRRLLINVSNTQSFVMEVEVLRGDLLDVVELKTGDQFKGTLKENSYALSTFYGPVELPVDRVVGVMNVGKFRPRQLVITSDGQIFGGTLKKQTVDLQLSSGQVTQIPLAQIARAGYRKRDGEPEEWTFDKPLVLMRSGERVGVRMPSAPLEVITRYGKVTLKPESVAAVLLQTEEGGAHEIHLTDGSKFTGLLSAEQFDMVLDAAAPAGAAAAPDQVVKFPTSTIARLQLVGKVAEPDEATSTLELANEDVLVGTLQGKLELETAFDTIAVNATEVKLLTHASDTNTDVSVTLWDGTTLSGQLKDQQLAVALASGATMKVPVALVVKYEQPQPQPSGQMIDKIKEVIADLNADDWKKRDRAQGQLVAMGPVAAGVLKKLRDAQPPEAQQRIDAVLKELEKPKGDKTAGASTNPAAGQ
jgi:hypothetical protein